MESIGIEHDTLRPPRVRQTLSMFDRRGSHEIEMFGPESPMH